MPSASRTSQPAFEAALRGKDRGAELRVALAQIAPVLGDRERNLALHAERIEAARRQQADLRRQRLITPLARDERLLVTVEELTRIKRRRYES